MPWDDKNRKMFSILPPIGGVPPHPTSHFGERRDNIPRASSPHGGVDFNYNVPGQRGLNLQHPSVYSPVDGTVVKEPGGYLGMVSIRDANGFLHEILHLQSQSVSKGQSVSAGQLIGSMGGVGAEGRQHVHYQIHDQSGNRVNPEAFWDDQRPASTYKPALDVPSLGDFRAFQALTESGPATFNERWSFPNPRGATPGIGDNNGIGDWWRNIGEDPKKMYLTANEPSRPLNAADRTGDSAQRVATGTQLFQGPNGQPVTDTMGWQDGIDSSLRQAPRLRLVSSQQQGDFDSSAVDRPPVDYGAAAVTAPDSSDDISKLLKLRSIIQAVGSRGLFPIQ